MLTISLRRQPLRTLLLIVLLVGTTACAATVTALKYKDLDVQAKMSETIFLDPVPPDKKTVWIEIKNTSDQDVDLSALTGMITAKGSRVVTDPNQAHYLLQANVLYVGKADQAAINQALRVGYGGPLAGIAIGGIAGAGIGQTPTGVGIGAAVGGLLGGAAEVVSGALVKAVTFTTITDVQLSERSATPVAQQQTANLTQGTQTRVYQNVAETSYWKRYRTRVASTATQVNLTFEEAKPTIIQGLTKSLAGIL